MTREELSKYLGKRCTEELLWCGLSTSFLEAGPCRKSTSEFLRPRHHSLTTVFVFLFPLDGWEISGNEKVS